MTLGPRSPFDPIKGRVFLQKKGPFTFPEEILHDHEQVPQFHPRTARATAPGPINGAYYATDEYPADLSHVARFYDPILPPMPAFDTNHDPGVYHHIHWHAHIATLHNLYYYDLPERLGLCWSQMQSLLAIASYGIGESMIWLPEFLCRSHGELGDYLTAPAREFKNMVVGDGNYDDLCDRDVTSDLNMLLRHRIHGKRWIVAPIRFLAWGDLRGRSKNDPTIPRPVDDSDDGSSKDSQDGSSKRSQAAPKDGHWVMSIFDRKHGHLYIQDTDRGTTPLHRDERIQTVVHTWARFWNEMGLAHHFQYFVCKGTRQPRNFECGHLGVLWVMQNLRNQVGECTLASGRDADRSKVWHRDVPIGKYEPENYLYEDSSLPLQDWMPGGCNSAHDGFDTMMKIINAMLRNELGIDDGDVTWRIENVVGFMRDPAGIPHEEYWTSLGGPQFVIPDQLLDNPTNLLYEPNAPRRHRPPGYPLDSFRVALPFVPILPSKHNPPSLPLAPDSILRPEFTDDKPMIPANHPPRLGVTAIKHYWEDPNYGEWDHIVRVMNSQGTDEDGLGTYDTRHPPLRLTFATVFSPSKDSIRILYRPSFLGGDYSSEVGYFDVYIGDGAGQLPPENGHSGGPPDDDDASVSIRARRRERLKEERSSAGDQSNAGDQSSTGENGNTEEQSSSPTPMDIDSPQESPAATQPSRKRGPSDCGETLSQGERRGSKKRHLESSSSGESTVPVISKKPKARMKKPPPGPPRRSSRVRRAAETYEGVERY